MELSLQRATIILERAMAEAKERFGRPVSVAVCDACGFLVVFARMDGVPLRTGAIAQGKAYTAARMGMDTPDFAARLQRENLPARAFCDDRFTEMPGGAVIRAAGGVIGGVGVSGLAPSEDQEVAGLAARSGA
jgi:uncharacterized protein GlcG (DUF336 family)